eukprot:CAMPEP_0196592092 /NCGR_PEP_ID=MMETSP1081-20130531/71734_1 /TAXON_ID=36882 /ORGANISM="Pyramimonas amylifera, Strain CCMP720" /LENGTH=291 /DNA_ID=CAMNT_0041915671 /DNA_START=314 /DNA_END=1189 /DNA_ORIENTATION=+
MSKEALLVYLDYLPEYNLLELAKTRDKYQYVQRGMLVGQVALGLPPAPNQEFVDQLEIIDQLWQPFLVAVNEILELGMVNKTELDVIDEYNIPLLAANNVLVGMYEKYATENAFGSDATPSEISAAINLAGRQRMFIQRMVKEYYLSIAGYDPEDNAAKAVSTASLFDQVMNGLEFGDESLNLAPAPSSDILYWIKQVNEVWQGESGLKAIIVEKPSFYKIETVAEKNIPILGRMNVIVGLYENPGTDLLTPPDAGAVEDETDMLNVATALHTLQSSLVPAFLVFLGSMFI